MSDQLWPEGSIPPHHHEWAWWFDNWGEDFYGIECTFTWLIPPGPRGKKPRVRTCTATIDQEELLRHIQETMED